MTGRHDALPIENLSTLGSGCRESLLLPSDWITQFSHGDRGDLQCNAAQLHRRSAARNLLLSALDASAYSQLLDGAENVHLGLRDVLYEANAPITHVFFLERGVASIIAPVGEGASVEVGTVGNEGFVGLPLLFGVDREPAKAFIQVADGGVRVTAAAFKKAVAGSEALRTLFLRYAQSYMSQVSQSSACNRAHSIEERCARWLLMTHDRVSDE